MHRVGPEVRGDEALHASLARGLDEEQLLLEGHRGQRGDDGVLALQGSDEGVEGVIVHRGHLNRVRELVVAALARQDFDLEAGGQELVQDGGA